MNLEKIYPSSDTGTQAIGKLERNQNLLNQGMTSVENQINVLSSDISVKYVHNGGDILEVSQDESLCPLSKRTLLRMFNSTTSPYASGDDDFIYDIIKADGNRWFRIEAFDIRSRRKFVNSLVDGTWWGWEEYATVSQIKSMQDQLQAISNILMETANLEQE